nr:NAD(+)--rifampin ADP-ribosyltransferase [Microvenator marinus]
MLGEVTSWNFYHGTKADLRPGDLIAPGFAANHGPTARLANYVYFTKTLDASIWGAELAVGEGPGRIYIVEPIGEYEDDPNLTNMKFKGNPTKSFRSKDALRVVAEVAEWTGHDASVVQLMKEGLQRLAEAGVEPED